MQKVTRVLVLCWLSAGCLEAGFVPLSLSSVANTTFPTFSSSPSYLLNGNLFPTGPQTYGGVPFIVGPVWSADVAAGGQKNQGLAQVTIPINTFGVTTIYTLMSSEWGSAFGTYVNLIFAFSDSSTYTVGLSANQAIRDYNNYTWTNSVASSWSAPLGMLNSTAPVWTDDGMPCTTPPGSTCSIRTGNYQRIDEQVINLPAVFQNLTLVSMTIADYGDHPTPQDALIPNPSDAQRSFISGLTVGTPTNGNIPEPGTWTLLLGGASAMVALRKRRAS